MDFTKQKVAALSEQVIGDTALNQQENMWNVDAYLRLLTAIGTIAGVATTTVVAGKHGLIGKMMAGASTGNQVGNQAGPYGGIIGAPIGGLVGMFG